MSRENAQNFLTEMQKNESQFKSLASMDGATVTKLAKEKGFNCTVDELKQVLTDARKGALSEKDLAGVAGGAGNQTRGINTSLVNNTFPQNLPIDQIWGAAPGGRHTPDVANTPGGNQTRGIRNAPGRNTPNS